MELSAIPQREATQVHVRQAPGHRQTLGRQVRNETEKEKEAEAEIETLIVVGVVAAILGAIAGILQVLLQWYTLQEIGELDNNESDFWEQAPWKSLRLNKRELNKSARQARELAKMLAWQRGVKYEEPED